MVKVPRKTYMIILLVLAAICLVDGSSKGDVKEILVGVVCSGYSVYSLVNDARKKKLNQGQP